MKYIKFIETYKDPNLVIGVEYPVENFGNYDELGDSYFITVNEQKYQLPVKFKEGHFKIIEKEDY